MGKEYEKKESYKRVYLFCVDRLKWVVEAIGAVYPYSQVHTTNIIEGLNRQFRQITKNKPSFTSDELCTR